MPVPQRFDKDHQIREAMRQLLLPGSAQPAHGTLFQTLLNSGPHAARLLPVLFGNLHHKPQELQQLAFDLALQLEKSGCDISALAAELASHLTSAHLPMRQQAAQMLERMGPSAKPAEDYVLGCLRNTDRAVALAGLRILRTIGPALSHSIGPRVQAAAELFLNDPEIAALVREVRGQVDSPAHDTRRVLREVRQRLQGRRVLVLDDDEAYRQTLADALRAAGAHVTEAASGAEGLRMMLPSPADSAANSQAGQQQASPPVAAAHWDLLLLDIRLPDISGLQVLSTLRKHGDRTPVIAISGVHSETVIHAARKAGISQYILKSTGLSVLLHIVADALSAR